MNSTELYCWYRDRAESATNLQELLQVERETEVAFMWGHISAHQRKGLYAIEQKKRAELEKTAHLR